METDELRTQGRQVQEPRALPGKRDTGEVLPEELLVPLTVARVMEHGVDVAQDLLRGGRGTVALAEILEEGGSVVRHAFPSLAEVKRKERADIVGGGRLVPRDPSRYQSPGLTARLPGGDQGE